jgi:hypothetical protein
MNTDATRYRDVAVEKRVALAFTDTDPALIAKMYAAGLLTPEEARDRIVDGIASSVSAEVSGGGGGRGAFTAIGTSIDEKDSADNTDYWEKVRKQNKRREPGSSDIQLLSDITDPKEVLVGFSQTDMFRRMFNVHMAVTAHPNKKKIDHSGREVYTVQEYRVVDLVLSPLKETEDVPPVGYMSMEDGCYAMDRLYRLGFIPVSVRDNIKTLTEEIRVLTGALETMKKLANSLIQETIEGKS